VDTTNSHGATVISTWLSPDCLANSTVDFSVSKDVKESVVNGKLALPSIDYYWALDFDIYLTCNLQSATRIFGNLVSFKEPHELVVDPTLKTATFLDRIINATLMTETCDVFCNISCHYENCYESVKAFGHAHVEVTWMAIPGHPIFTKYDNDTHYEHSNLMSFDTTDFSLKQSRLAAASLLVAIDGKVVDFPEAADLGKKGSILSSNGQNVYTNYTL
jgi:hypothetical protein